MSSLPDEQPEELQDEQVVDLPARHALSIVDPGIFGAGLPPALGRIPDPTPVKVESAEPAPTSA
jgi:hypothetical protein